ncbi:MAG: YciI family protein [Chloroflexi bacterium]|nr:YciI family protein [Chloroflexota bacterium]MDA1271547.1 YciI family protein [Chloroflexota bacterium]
MKYLFLIYDNEQTNMNRSPEEMSKTMDAWFKYTADLQSSGLLLAGEALQPTMAATTVRSGNPAPLATDGPFAETKEQLGGFYMVDAPDLDNAIEWAGKMPHIAEGGTVEIRPIMEFDH